MRRRRLSAAVVSGLLIASASASASASVSASASTSVSTAPAQAATAVVASAAATVDTAAGGFIAVPPSRLLDTRGGLGAPRRSVPAHGTISLQVTGRNGIPAGGVAAAVLNITVSAPSTRGYVSVFGAGSARPAVSSLNFVRAQTVANLVFAPIGANGRVSLYNGSGGTLQLLADVSGYYLAGAVTSAGSYVAVSPVRALDTRGGLGAPRHPVGARDTVALAVTGRDGVPASGVASVVLTVTATAPKASGFISVFGSGTPRPTVSSVNFGSGQTVANLVIAPVGADGVVDLYNGSSASTQLIADVSGYILGGDPRPAGAFVAMTPTRILDTRPGIVNGRPVPRRPVPGLQSYSAGLIGKVSSGNLLPTTGVAAVVLNVTVVNPSARGYLTVYGQRSPRPTVSNLNFVKGRTVANLVIAPFGNGSISMYNGSGGVTDVVIDIYGYLRSERAHDVTGPKPVSQFGAMALTQHSARLSWTNPADPDLAAVMVRRTLDTKPLNPQTGTLVATLAAAPLAAGSVVDSDVHAGQVYTYAAFAVDNDGNYSGFNPAAAIATPLSWTVPQPVDGQHLVGVSCASASFCMAIDQVGNAVRFDGSSWSAPAQLESTSLRLLSCPTAGFCLAIDSVNQVFRFDGSSWSSPTLTGDSNPIQALSCISATFCVALDSQGAATTFDGSTWSAAVGVGSRMNWQAVSCAAATFCAALSASGYASSFNGSTWTAPTQVAALVISPLTLSCPTADFCVAGFGNGNAEYHAGSWTGAPAIRGSELSCSSISFCVGVSSRHGAQVRPLVGITSRIPAVAIDPSPIVGISCPVEPFCMAVSSSGDAVWSR